MAFNIMNPSTRSISSKRGTKFLQTIDKALLESKRKIDTDEVVENCYGDDAAIFIGSDDTISFSPLNNKNKKRSRNSNEKDDDENRQAKKMLSNLIANTLESINANIKREVKELVLKENTDEKLTKLEEYISVINKKDNEIKEREHNNRQEIKRIMSRFTKFPEGCSPLDIVKYRIHKTKCKEKEDLLAEIKSLEDQNQSLQVVIEEKKDSIEKKMGEIEALGNSVSELANMCSSA